MGKEGASAATLAGIWGVVGGLFPSKRGFPAGPTKEDLQTTEEKVRGYEHRKRHQSQEFLTGSALLGYEPQLAGLSGDTSGKSQSTIGPGLQKARRIRRRFQGVKQWQIFGF